MEVIKNDAIEMLYFFNMIGEAARIVIGCTGLIRKNDFVSDMVLSPESMNQDKIEGIYLRHKWSRIVDVIILNDELGKVCTSPSSSKEEMTSGIKVLLDDLKDLLLNKMSRDELKKDYDLTEKRVINLTNFSNYNDQMRYPATYYKVHAKEIAELTGRPWWSTRRI